MQKFTTPEQQATARAYIDKLRKHEFEAIEKAADPSIRNENLHQDLAKMASLIPAGEPQAVKLVGAHTNITGDTRTVNLTFEFRFGEQWMLVNVATLVNGGTTTIVGMGVLPQRESLEERNRFNLAGKGPAHYLILSAAVAAALFTLYALVLCIRTKFPRRKWLWIMFVLAGFGMVGINWTTGQVFFTPLAIQLFSAAASSELYGPMMVSVSIPVGAIVFLLQRKRYRVPTLTPG